MKGKVLIVVAVCSAFLLGTLMPAHDHVTGARAQTATAGGKLAHLQELIGYEVLLHGSRVPAGGFLRTSIKCPPGKEILGGGAQVIREGSADFHTVIQGSGPGTIERRYLWAVAIKNKDVTDHKVGLFAICADLSARFKEIG